MNIPVQQLNNGLLTSNPEDAPFSVLGVKPVANASYDELCVEEAKRRRENDRCLYNYHCGEANKEIANAIKSDNLDGKMLDRIDRQIMLMLGRCDFYSALMFLSNFRVENAAIKGGRAFNTIENIIIYAVKSRFPREYNEFDNFKAIVDTNDSIELIIKEITATKYFRTGYLNQGFDDVFDRISCLIDRKYSPEELKDIVNKIILGVKAKAQVLRDTKHLYVGFPEEKLTPLSDLIIESFESKLLSALSTAREG